MMGEKVGAIWIDTASVVVGEPCFLIRGDGETPRITWERFVEQWEAQGDRVPDEMAKAYNALIERLGKDDERHPETRRSPTDLIRLPQPGSKANGAIAVRTCENCDGWVTVYLERDSKGRPRRLVIDLDTKVEP